MATMKHVNPDDIRTLFSRAMSEMYRAEAPQYGALLELVADVNDETLRRDPDLKASLERAGELDRLSVALRSCKRGEARLTPAAPTAFAKPASNVAATTTPLRPAPHRRAAGRR